jgi:hypothetical protein
MPLSFFETAFAGTNPAINDFQGRRGIAGQLFLLGSQANPDEGGR